MKIEPDALLFERPWFPTVFRLCRENGLDWIRMCAIALINSKGDPRYRIVDWEFMHSRLGEDNPVFAQYYVDGEPMAELIDRATTWGLFQIHGQTAVEQGYEGRLVNLIDVTKNAQIFSNMIARAITAAAQADSDNPIADAEEGLGINYKLIDAKVHDLKEELEPFVEEFGYYS